MLCPDLLAFTLKLRKTSETSARRPSDGGCATSYRLKWGPLPPNDLVGWHSRSGREEGGKEKELGGRVERIGPAVHGVMGCTQKSFKLVWRATTSCPGS